MKPIPYHTARRYDSPKMYLSVGDSRRLAAEMPVGDPFGGPAYGARAMPIIGVAMAVGSFASGAAAFAAGTATFMTGLSMAASALSVVGAISGNTMLSTIGGVLSMGAGMSGGFGGADVLSDAGSAAANAADVAGGMDPSVGLAESASDVAGKMASDMGNDLSGAMGVTADAAGSGTSQMLPASGAPQADPAVLSANAAQQPTLPDAAANPMSTGEQNSYATDTLSKTSSFDPNAGGGDGGSVSASQTGNDANGLVGSAGQSGATSGGGLFDKISSFTKNNPGLTKIGLDVLGGLVPSKKQEAELELARAQAARIRNATAEDKERQLWRRGLIG